MTLEFRALPPALADTAERAIGYFIDRWGVKKSKVLIEHEVDPEVGFRPTFVAKMNDLYTLCVEVRDTIYNESLADFVLQCRDKGLAVKVVVAVPRDPADPQFAARLRSAKVAGLGILEVGENSAAIIQMPVPLSLAGVRDVDSRKFPPRYRQPLQQAYEAFRNGEPPKACAIVYDELEATCRQLAKKAVKMRLYTTSLDIDSAAWASLLRNMDKHLKRSDPVAQKITETLIARIIGITPHRNESGHKPKTMAELLKRDRQLRTRFETAVDLLSDLVEAARPFRL
jgi:hypothetical protein